MPALPRSGGIDFRIGINVGDIVEQDGDIFGDGVNIAARLEGIAEPGGICVSQRVQEDAAGKTGMPLRGHGRAGAEEHRPAVRAYRLRPPAQSRRRAPTAATPPPLPDKPSIAVLPFQNMSGDPEQEYFADGITEDIITALSKLRGFFVIARNSTFAYKGKAPDVRQVARELGVRYVLEGSVRKAGERLRVTGQLIDASTGQPHLGRALRPAGRRHLRRAGRDHRQHRRHHRGKTLRRREPPREDEADGKPRRVGLRGSRQSVRLGRR